MVNIFYWIQILARLYFALYHIIRTNHGQTEIVMQYGGLRGYVTCVTTSWSNDSFATHITNQSLDKGLWYIDHLVHMFRGFTKYIWTVLGCGRRSKENTFDGFVNTYRYFPHSWLIAGFVTRLSRRLPLTEIVMQYGGLRGYVTCVTTSWSNDSFATHITNQSLDKGLWYIDHLVHMCVTQLLYCFRWIVTVANTSTEFIP
jgi:hypothetical protein